MLDLDELRCQGDQEHNDAENRGRKAVNRNLSQNIAKGYFGGPREIKGGDYLRANISKNSGAKNQVPGISPIVDSAKGAYAQRNIRASR